MLIVFLIAFLIVVFTVPVYRDDRLPTITLNSNVLLINWTESFYINAELRSFTLYKNYLTEYIGKDAFYSDRTSARNVCESLIWKQQFLYNFYILCKIDTM